MTSLLLALVLAQDAGVDAGVHADFKAPIYASCPDAPPFEVSDGGLTLTLPGDIIGRKERGERLACLMTTCDVDRQQKAARLDEQPAPWWWVTATGAAVLLAAGAFALGRVTAPSPATPAQ